MILLRTDSTRGQLRIKKSKKRYIVTKPPLSQPIFVPKPSSANPLV